MGDAKHGYGDTPFVAEISLGCFGPNSPHIEGAEEDECCDDVSSTNADAPIR